MSLQLAQPHIRTQMVSPLLLPSLFLGFVGSFIGPGNVNGPDFDFQSLQDFESK